MTSEARFRALPTEGGMLFAAFPRQPGLFDRCRFDIGAGGIPAAAPNPGRDPGI